MRYPLLAITLVCLFSFGCNKKHHDQPTPPVAPQSVPPPADEPPSAATGLGIFTGGELTSGGGAFLYPDSGNHTISFDNDIIRYVWNGEAVKGQRGFAGFDLPVASGFATYDSTPARDLRPGHYRLVSFNVRGTLSADTVIKVEISDDGDGGRQPPCLVLSTNGTDTASSAGFTDSCINTARLETSLHQVLLAVNETDLANVKDYFKATFVCKKAPAGTCNGGEVFFDEIIYQP